MLSENGQLLLSIQMDKLIAKYGSWEAVKEAHKTELQALEELYEKAKSTDKRWIGDHLRRTGRSVRVIGEAQHLRLLGLDPMLITISRDQKREYEQTYAQDLKMATMDEKEKILSHTGPIFYDHCVTEYLMMNYYKNNP